MKEVPSTKQAFSQARMKISSEAFLELYEAALKGFGGVID